MAKINFYSFPVIQKLKLLSFPVTLTQLLLCSRNCSNNLISLLKGDFLVASTI